MQNPTPINPTESVGELMARGFTEGLTGTAPENPSPVYQRVILHALPRLGKHVYAGTVTPAEKARRRAATKAQRAARRQNRSSK